MIMCIFQKIHGFKNIVSLFDHLSHFHFFVKIHKKLCFSGTITPMSGMGKLIGGFCAVFGAFTIVLPVPIIVNSFANFYRNRLWRGEVAIKRRERLNQVRKSLSYPTMSYPILSNKCVH
jgi:hypothetical protein